QLEARVLRGLDRCSAPRQAIDQGEGPSDREQLIQPLQCAWSLAQCLTELLLAGDARAALLPSRAIDRLQRGPRLHQVDVEAIGEHGAARVRRVALRLPEGPTLGLQLICVELGQEALEHLLLRLRSAQPIDAIRGLE